MAGPDLMVTLQIVKKRLISDKVPATFAYSKILHIVEKMKEIALASAKCKEVSQAVNYLSGLPWYFYIYIFKNCDHSQDFFRKDS